MSIHAWQFAAICAVGIVYFAARYQVICWWRSRDAFAAAMHKLIDADKKALKARGK